MTIPSIRPVITCILLLAFLFGACANGSSVNDPSSGNLFPNPSFEGPQVSNQWGQSFKDWGGWVYEKPARMAIGTIARTGNYSQGIVADQGGKVRLISSTLKLDPGRYKVQLYLRGLDVGRGVDKNPIDFSVGYDNRFPGIDLKGSFGWTPITYVFEIDRPIENFKLLVGLVRSGWLWIDDASLTRVDKNVALTKDPVVGTEEQPFAPAGSFPAEGLRCPECGFHTTAASVKCLACGHAGSKDVHGLPLVKVLADFEDGKSTPFRGGSLTGKKPLQGRFSLESKELLSMVQPQDWTGYDYIRFDVYNPNDTPASLYVEIRDKQTKDYWTRVNYDTVAPPGRSTVSIPTSVFVGEKSRPGRPLIKDAVTHLFINPKGMQLRFDNVRLERVALESVRFPELQAFDFGPLDSPVMAGFQKVVTTMGYASGRGFGWFKADLWRSFNALQPDALYQDFICPRSGSFRVDLPNGRYKVVMNIDSPGGYWGEVQVYEKRRVVANGVTVVNETMDASKFKKHYFRNAHREDLPGLDTFSEYVEKMFNLKEFEVEVSDGKLDLRFEGDGFAISLSSLIVFPLEKRAEGEKFLGWVTEQRRSQFNDYFKQILPKKTGVPAPAGDYALFSRYFMKPVNAYDGPLDQELIGPDGLSASLAQGEEGAVTFSVQPSGSLAAFDIGVTDLKFSGNGKKQVAPLPASTLNPGWIDYRISRITMEGSVYSVGPRFWHPLPAPAAPGVTRTFWFRVRPPVGTEPGRYQGMITVKAHNGKTRSFPLTVNVLPFSLDPIKDVAVGPWGASIPLPWLGKDPKTAEWGWQMFSKSLDVIRDAGGTSFSGIPQVRVSGKDQRIKLDTTMADKQMALARSKGFRHLISSYGAGVTGYTMYGSGGGADANASKAAGFPDAQSFLKAVYQAIDEHAKQNNWLPVAWNICDEPIGDAVKQSVANALVHRKAAEGLELTTFMGATSMTGNNPKDPHYELVKALLLPSLNLHDEGSLSVLREAGNRLSFYNGASRWTYGRYMKMLVLKHQLDLRLSWHFNVAVGDPYYALDCREDDYSWYNTDADQTMIPSMALLTQIIPGLNDYRYLSTLQRLLKERPGSTAANNPNKVFETMVNLVPGKDRGGYENSASYEQDRKMLVDAISGLLAR